MQFLRRTSLSYSHSVREHGADLQLRTRDQPFHASELIVVNLLQVLGFSNEWASLDLVILCSVIKRKITCPSVEAKDLANGDGKDIGVIGVERRNSGN